MAEDTELAIAGLLRMGGMGLELGYWQQAEAYYDAVLERAPGHRAALLGKARACRNAALALDLVRQVLCDAPGDQEALQLETEFLAQQRLVAQAVEPSAPVAAARAKPRLARKAIQAWPALALALALVVGGLSAALWRARQPARTNTPTARADLVGAVAQPGTLLAPADGATALNSAYTSLALLLAVDRPLRYMSQGSGSIISEDGLVLTNYHVVANSDRTGLANPDGLVLVGLTQDAREAPGDWYIGVLVAQDATRDLAVLRLLYTADGRAIRGRSFTALPWGDSDTLALGQPLVGLGYPAIGGNTLTLVRGSMAGFASDENGVRYGKTDSELAPGSSGGAVLNEAGALVGVMTSVVRDDETQGRLGYFVLLNDARALVADAQRTPTPHPEVDWLVAFYQQQVRPAE